MVEPRSPETPSWTPGPPASPRHSIAGTVFSVVLVALMVVVAALAILSVTPRDEPPAAGDARPGGADLVAVGGIPVAWDPALIGDATSAATLTQVWEGLTAFDADGTVRPALAESWELSDEGRGITFRLRDGVAFSDGTPIRAEDVVNSWLRVLDPARPSPLAGLLGDVRGAREYLAGVGPREAVEIRADGDTVTVGFRRPAAYFPAVAASPTLAVVPSDLPDAAAGPVLPDGMVVSGAYVPSAMTATGLTLTANDRYWAGRPAIGTIALTTDTGGRSLVEVFQSGSVDLTPIGSADASWIRYDRELGPQLRRTDDLAVEFYGFDTTRPPFDDARVRRAFAMAVDWHRLVELGDDAAVVATSLVPRGIPGRGEGDFTPRYDPEGARAELAAAGFPGGEGFPTVTLVTSGSSFDEAVAQGLEDVLGIDMQVEVMPFTDYSARLSRDPPQMWDLSWIADYPHAQDFLGLLLESGSSANTGGWSDAGFDAALEAAASTADPVAQEAAYTEAQRIVQEQVPVVPLRYSESWSLSREGLLGAEQSGMGFVRFAGLAWEGDR